MRAIALLISIIVWPSFVVADEYKELTDAAYCAGVIVQYIDLAKRDFGAVADSRADQQLLARKTTFIEGAIKQNKIDIETTNRFVAIGQADARLCWETLKKCVAEATQRAEKKVDIDVSINMQRNCERAGEAVCTRINTCQ
jgi:hypothetical protein